MKPQISDVRLSNVRLSDVRLSDVRRLWTTVSFGAFLLVTLSTAPLISQDKVVKGPVVGNVQKDRATLTWVTHKTIGAVTAQGSQNPVSIVEPVYHEVELRGLTPGTRYNYDLSAYGAEERGSFLTAPDGDAPFKFVVYGDNRSRHEVHRRVASRVAAEKPDFILHTGDLVNNGLLSEDWDIFFEIEKDILRNAAFFPSLGNHDRNAPVFFKYFSFPGGNGHRYSFDWGNAHFIALNSNEVGTTTEARAAFFQEQLDWLREDLRRNRRPFTFVYFHHPLYSAVETRKASAARLAAKLEPALKEGGVTAVFAGHDHNYQHHLQDGLHHIVTGGGGAPLYDVSPIPEITLKAIKIENFVRVRIEGNKALVEAVDVDGNILDSFEMAGRTVQVPTAAPVRQ